MDILTEYLLQDALIVIPVLIILGKIIKETTLIGDRFIPITLLIVGIAFTIAIMGFNVGAIIQGVLVAGGAVFSNQFYRQLKEDDN